MTLATEQLALLRADHDRAEADSRSLEGLFHLAYLEEVREALAGLLPDALPVLERAGKAAAPVERLRERLELEREDAGLRYVLAAHGLVRGQVIEVALAYGRQKLQRVRIEGCVHLYEDDGALCTGTAVRKDGTLGRRESVWLGGRHHMAFRPLGLYEDPQPKKRGRKPAK